MAKNHSAPQVDFQLPEGFQLSGSDNAVGWFNQQKIGNTLRGSLIGMFERPDQLRKEGTSKFFQVRVSQPCEVRADRGDDATMVEAKAGDVVNVNYGPKTKNWEDLVADIKRGAEYEVIGCIVGDKVKLSGGRNMHNLKVGERLVRPPRASTESDVDFEGSAAEDQV